MNKLILVVLLPSLLAGCAGSPKYACGLPKGIACKPVGEVYEASVAGSLHGGRTDRDTKPDSTTASVIPAVKGANTAVVATVKPNDPLLSPPRQLRVWINRWEDQAGDLHDETYLYLRLDNGAWRLHP